MMNALAEDIAVNRATTLAEARRLCAIWGYWCVRTNVRTGYEPYMSTGGMERRYRAPWQWDTPPPNREEANEPVGMDVQRAFAALPRIYRLALIAEFCFRPWLIVLDGKIEILVAKKARLREDNYRVTLERSLLALANVMKQRGLWCE